MKLKKKELELLTTFMAIAKGILESQNGAKKKNNGARRRRSAADVVVLKKQILAARKRNVPVKEIADEYGVTPSYIYQIANAF